MPTPGEFSFHEISTQGSSWQSAIEAALSLQGDLNALTKCHRGQRVIFIGCGSTHYLALYAAPFFQRLTGHICRGLPSSELWLQGDTILAPGESALIVALSRSGETSETIQAAEAMVRRGCEVLTISCYDHTPLADLSAVTLCVPGGREQSYAQTRSFAGMLVAVQALAAVAAGDAAALAELRRLPSLAEGVIERAREMAARLGPREAYKRITYLGSGPLYGLACEATVKMKEMSLSAAEGYHFMEFRHGPMALVDDEHLVVGLLSDELRGYELAVLRDLRERAGHIVAVANDAAGLSTDFEGSLQLGLPLPEWARGVFYLPLVQWLAYYRAMARGLNPDRPRHVVMAIRLDHTGTSR